jgi:hypothetical protein
MRTDDDHVLEAGKSCLTWPGSAARLSTVGGVRTRPFRFQARRSRRTGGSPARLRFCSPSCSPDDRFGVTSYGRDPQHRTEVRELRAGN